MKNLIISALIALSIPVNAQCFTKNEVDEFTGATIKKTENEYLFIKLSESSFLSFSQVDSFFYVDLTYIAPNVYSVSEGSSLMFKLSDSTVITLKSLSYEISDCSYVSGMSSCHATIDYLIEKKDLVKLSEFEISKIRIYTTDGYIEKEIKHKNAVGIANKAKCLLQN